MLAMCAANNTRSNGNSIGVHITCGWVVWLSVFQVVYGPNYNDFFEWLL